jgi:hypothetical protein
MVSLMSLSKLLGSRVRQSNRFCIPANDARGLTPAELSFFERGTSGGESETLLQCDNPSTKYLQVPVVVIFTKFDSRRAKEIGKLVEPNGAIRDKEAQKRILSCRPFDLYPDLERDIRVTANPPASYIYFESRFECFLANP